MSFGGDEDWDNDSPPKTTASVSSSQSGFGLGRGRGRARAFPASFSAPRPSPGRLNYSDNQQSWKKNSARVGPGGDTSMNNNAKQRVGNEATQNRFSDSRSSNGNGADAQSDGLKVVVESRFVGRVIGKYIYIIY